MTYFLDVECYPNYFLVGLKKLKGPYLFFESPNAELKEIIAKNRIVTFNGVRYDFPMLAAFLEGYTCETLFKLSKNIINNSMTDAFRKFKNRFIYQSGYELADLIDIAPGVMVSLKMYGARMHYKNLKDLPYTPETILDDSQKEEIKNYNKKDLDITQELYLRIKEDIDLRDNLHTILDDSQNLFIKGNAALGEYLVIRNLKRGKSPSYREVVYNPPENIHLKSISVRDLVIPLDDKGSPMLVGDIFKQKIQIGKTSYKFGLGGLHSQESNLITDGDKMCNADVTSFYPSLILEYNFKPSAYGDDFLEAYRRIYLERIQAKKDGDNVINAAYKLALNSVFGKLGNKYSPLYDPAMLLNVTLTGQLLLLMLIEMLEENGCNVISANTDGVEFQGEPGNVLKEWETISKMQLEFNTYNKLYARDVNNYIAIWGNKTKSKGIYAEPDLKKSWEHPIIFTAIKEYLLNQTPVEETINNCQDLRQFLLIRNVTGGCVYRDEFKGRVARWYYGTEGDLIYYQKNGNKVPKSDNAVFVSELNSIKPPKNLNRDYYIDLALNTFPLNVLLNK